MESYQLGVNRVLEVTKDDKPFGVVIKDINTSAEALFPNVRWSFFLSCMDDIDKEVAKLQEGKEEFRFRQHYGGGWYASVTSGIRCVDLRRFFMNKEGEIKPTRHGIGLRLPEWEKFKDVLKEMATKEPSMVDTLSCFHQDLSEWVKCKECFPFPFYADACPTPPAPVNPPCLSSSTTS